MKSPKVPSKRWYHFALPQTTYESFGHSTSHQHQVLSSLKIVALQYAEGKAFIPISLWFNFHFSDD